MNDFKERALFTSLVFLYCVFIFLIADASLGYNSIPISRSLNKIAFAISPQGWGFFTRNPREPLIDLYLINNHQLEKISIPNASLKYAWGFNRGMRASSSQIAYFVDQIPEDKWILDPRHKADSIIQTSDPFTVLNDFSCPVHCGKFLLAKTERIPWAWSKHEENLKIPRSVVIIDVTCRAYE